MSETSGKRAGVSGQDMVNVRSPLYWVCRDQDEVMARLCVLMQLPPIDHLTEEELEMVHKILRDADDMAHESICTAVRHWKKERDGGDGRYD